MTVEISQPQATALATNPYTVDGKLFTYTDENGKIVDGAKEQYTEDLSLLKRFIQDNRIGEKLSEKELTTAILSLPDLENGTATNTHFQSTAKIVHSYAQNIIDTQAQADPSKRVNLQNLTRNDGDALRQAVRSGIGQLSPGGDNQDIKLKGKDLSFNFAVKPFAKSERNLGNNTSITSTTSHWGTGVTSLTGKATGKLGLETVKPYLSNPSLRSIEVGNQKLEFARMGYLQTGQSQTISDQIDILQLSTEKVDEDGRPNRPHFDLRLMNSEANRSLLGEHQRTIDGANALRDAGSQISTCTIPINQNKHNAWDLAKFGLVTAASAAILDEASFGQKALGITAIALGVILSPILLPAIGIASLFNIDKGCVDEWTAATPGIDRQLRKFEEMLTEQPDNIKAAAIIHETRTLLNSISNGLDLGNAPKGTDGLMLSVLMMKTADALGMSVSEGCKSNKDRGTVVDMMAQALEIKNKDNTNTYDRLDFALPGDRAIFKEVVMKAETRHTSLNNTGVPGNMFASGDFPSILGLDGLSSFTGIGPLGKA